MWTTFTRFVGVAGLFVIASGAWLRNMRTRSFRQCLDEVFVIFTAGCEALDAEAEYEAVLADGETELLDLGETRTIIVGSTPPEMRN